MSLEESLVLECANTYQQTLDREKSKGTPAQDAEQLARQDFFRAMPCLDDQESIRGFLGCVSYAMLNGMVDPQIASKLLYSAQIASSSLRSRIEF